MSQLQFAENLSQESLDKTGMKLSTPLEHFGKDRSLARQKNRLILI